MYNIEEKTVGIYIILSSEWSLICTVRYDCARGFLLFDEMQKNACSASIFNKLSKGCIIKIVSKYFLYPRGEMQSISHYKYFIGFSIRIWIIY